MSGESSQVTDIEVGRYALRTFRIYEDHKLHSVAKQYIWEEGKAIAQCLPEQWVPGLFAPGPTPRAYRPPCLASPGPDCQCGIYGTLTLDHLLTQYYSHASHCVAVIAAEGETIIGDTGLRTAAARIVGYWGDEVVSEIFAVEAPGAKGFDTIEALLEYFNFPKSAWTLELQKAQANPRRGDLLFNSFSGYRPLTLSGATATAYARGMSSYYYGAATPGAWASNTVTLTPNFPSVLFASVVVAKKKSWWRRILGK